MGPPDSQNLCPVCSEGSFKSLLQKGQDGDKAKPLRLRMCAECSTTFLEDRNQWYSLALYDYYGERLGLTREALYDPITEKRYAELLLWLRGFASGKRILDIGCGQGHFVDAALRRGYLVQGIETSRPAVEICKQFGLPVKQLDAFSHELEPSSFDVCTLFEVIEHVPQPVQLLQRVEELLVLGGYLYLTTPNYDSLERYLMREEWNVICAEHLTYFTPRTIRSLITRCTSLEVLMVETRNIGVNELRRYLTKRLQAVIRGGCRTRKKLCSGTTNVDYQLREAVESSWALRLAKACVNRFLGMSGLGSGMRVLCRK